MALTFMVLFAFLVFFFLFSKPAYKEFRYRLPRSEAKPILKINFQIEQGDIVLVPDSLTDILRIDGTMQGFGFPDFKFKNEINKRLFGDTLKLTFASTLSGFFYEKDIVFTCRFDTTRNFIFSGKVEKGNLFLRMNNKIEETTFHEINLFCR